MLIPASHGTTVLVIADGHARCAGAVLALEVVPGQRARAFTAGGAIFDADTAQPWCLQNDDGTCDDPAGRHRTLMDWFKAVTGRAWSIGPLVGG